MLYSFRLNLYNRRLLKLRYYPGTAPCISDSIYYIFRFLLDSWACIQRTREMGSTLFNRLCNGQSCICRHVRGRRRTLAWLHTLRRRIGSLPPFDPWLFERWRLLLYASITLPISVLLSSLFRLFVWLVFAFSLVCFCLFSCPWAWSSSLLLELLLATDPCNS